MGSYLIPFAGGCLIGLGSLLALAASGKIPGVSGVIAKVLRPKKSDTLWRVLYLIGLIAGAGLMFGLVRGAGEFSLPGGRSLTVVAVAGFLVGFGTRLGGGCTSGHGICGIGAGARDAMVYTIVFMAAGAATAFLWNLIMKGAAA